LCDKNGGRARHSNRWTEGNQKVHQVEIANRSGKGSISGRRVFFSFPLALSVRGLWFGSGWVGLVGLRLFSRLGGCEGP